MVYMEAGHGYIEGNIILCSRRWFIFIRGFMDAGSDWYKAEDHGGIVISYCLGDRINGESQFRSIYEGHQVDKVIYRIGWAIAPCSRFPLSTTWATAGWCIKNTSFQYPLFVAAERRISQIKAISMPAIFPKSGIHFHDRWKAKGYFSWSGCHFSSYP